MYTGMVKVSYGNSYGYDGKVLYFACMGPEEAGRADSMWQHRLTRPLHKQTKLILIYFKRGSTLNLNGFSVKIFFT